MYLLFTAVQEIRKRFTFTSVTFDVAKDINILDNSKVIQETDLPVKLMKDNNNFLQVT